MIDYEKMLNNIVSVKEKMNDGISKHILKTDTIGNVITGRVLPNIKDIDPETGAIPTEYSYYCHFVRSKIDNSNMYVNCLNTLGKPCPICKKSIEMWKSGDESKKKRSEGIRRQHNFVTNFYVINDVKNPANNGKVMLLKYGKQLDMKIKGALEGELAEFYGKRIYRLDEQGCTFMIKAEKNADTKNSKNSYVTYTNSTFLPAGPIVGMTPEKMNEIMDATHCLSAPHQVCKTPQELIDLLNKHYFINDVQQTSNADVETFTGNTGASTGTGSSDTDSSNSKKSDVASVDEATLDDMIKELG